jgi:hypothetical protein
MSENKKQTIALTEHIGNIVFDKKEDSSIIADYNLEEQIVLYSNKVLGVKVQSVVLPANYLPQPKTETQVMDWLRNKIQSRHSFAYSMSLKYGEKTNLKLEKKEPYNNN